MNCLLKTLSYPYAAAVAIRNKLYDCGILPSYKPKIPLVGIGNLTVGGSGKTPFAIYLGKLLIEQNKLPAILCKGYKGKNKKPCLVKITTPYKVVGDEALLLKNSLPTLPVIASFNKNKGVYFIEQNLNVSLIIGDDLFQHRALKPCCSIVLIDITTPQIREEILKNKLLPWGRLREPVANLKRADIVILVNRSLKKIKAHEINNFKNALKLLVTKGSLPIYYSYIDQAEIISGKSGKKTSLLKTALFCGIAEPSGFVQTVQELGIKVTKKFFYPDHHSFSKKELENLLSYSPLLCTEKDFMRIPNEVKEKVYFLRIGTRISEEDSFLGMIDGFLQHIASNNTFKSQSDNI